MSTWTFDAVTPRRALRRGLSLWCVLALSGCVGVESGASDDALQQVSLFKGEVVVAGPRGYCVDGAQLRRGSFGAFVPIASCESLSGQAGIGVEPVLMTVSVLPRQDSRAMPDAAEIAASMAEDKPLEMIDGDGVSIVHFATGGERALPGGDPRYWRAGMIVNGHLLGLAVYAPKDSPLAGGQGKRLISDLAEGLRNRSPQMRAVTSSRGETAAVRRGIAGWLPGGLFPNPG